MGLNLRADEEDKTQPQPSKKANSHLESLKEDQRIWHLLANGDSITATVKENLNDYKKDEYPTISDEMLALRGKRESFTCHRMQRDGNQIWLLKGFGYYWHEYWLKDFELIYHKEESQ